MPSTSKSLSHSMEDEDSYNYLDAESETITDCEPSDVSEYNYKDAFCDIIYTRNFFFLLLCFIGLILSLVLWRFEITIIFLDEKTKEISLGYSLAILSFLGLASIGLGYLTEKASQKLMKNSKSIDTFWFYSSELAFFFSLGVMLTVLNFFLFKYYDNFYVKNPYNFKLTVFDFLRILLGTVVLLAFQKGVVKKISMGFNYNTFINRIRKCIFLDFFISLVTHINEFDDDYIVSSEFDNQEKGKQNGVVTHKSGPHNNYNFLFQNRFRSRNAEDLSFSAKRVLIKEFQSSGFKARTYSGNLPAILWKIKSKAAKKATKLVKKLIRSDKIEKIGDLKRLFNESVMFEYFLEQINLSKNDKIEKTLITNILEKAYKDKYVINKNIEQINSAINRVAFCVKIFTYFLAMLTCYITATGEINIAVGILSAIFGTQFISNILSDNILQSIIFLFIIHPFDIGDRVLIKLNGENQNMVVAELNVFSTLFFKWDGTSLFVPNRVLANTPISNIRRSGSVMECHSIQINTKTDPEKIAKLREMLIEFCRKNSEFYTDYILVNYERIEDSNKLFLKVLMQYQNNWQHYESYLKKRSIFVSELNRCINILKITYTLPVQRIKMRQIKN